MILLAFRTPQGPRLGVKRPAGVLHVEQARQALMPGDASVPVTVEDVLAGGPAALAALERLVERAEAAGRGAPWWLEEPGLRYAPCVPRPPKIVCIGLNYRRHAEEAGARVPEVPVLFSKFGNSVAACGDVIPMPPDDERMDYEAELTLVIGRGGRHIPRRQALRHVLGYCNGNDLSARRLQFLTGQWLLGKTLDGFCPIGPYLVTADEVPDPQALAIRCWVNGELRQNSHTADMIFPCDYLVWYVSRYITLEPGDIILTGTPEGVALGRKDHPHPWLRPGDVVAVEIEGLGRLENTIGPPAAAPADQEEERLGGTAIESRP